MNQASPNNSGAQIIVKIFAAAMVIVIAAVFALILWWWFTPPQIVVEADAGFKKAKQTVNPEELRQWALEEINRRPATNGWNEIPESEIPSRIRYLYPNHPIEKAWVAGDIVLISWGGGFFGWEIEVGSTNFSEPFNSGNPECPYNFEWVRGIYYKREGDWKLQ
ncbi:MAG TPA: hypothetical protein VN516_05845 [Candidatus Baltobacteraceae bacterium]|nr:hypothetical protein [Candidatus Baltobacteraceae bacterium]